MERWEAHKRHSSIGQTDVFRDKMTDSPGCVLEVIQHTRCHVRRLGYFKLLPPDSGVSLASLLPCVLICKFSDRAASELALGTLRASIRYVSFILPAWRLQHLGTEQLGPDHTVLVI